METKKPDELPTGIIFQAGPGEANSIGWLYPMGTKLTVNSGNCRNFELCATTYPCGDLVFRQYNPWSLSWDPWRQIVMYDNNGRLNTKSIFVQGGDNLTFCTNSNFERMRIDALGNVGIGTSDPQNLLDVKGTIRAKQVKVVGDSEWPDFVFKPDFQLKPLSEVEQYITTNGHLPEIPTAKQVEQNGVNLGEMNVKLLQKVEEITLYLIEQKKINEEQSKEIQLLKEQVNKLSTKK